MTYLALLPASRGRRAGFSAVAGIAPGLTAVGLAAALGLAAIIAASPLPFGGLRWGGIVYLLYLAWSAWSESSLETEQVAADSRFFAQGLLTNLLNPKAAVFCVTILPAFVPAESGWLSPITLAGVYVLIATAVHATIVTLAGTLPALLTGPRVKSLAGKLSAVGLVAVSIWVASATR